MGAGGKGTPEANPWIDLCFASGGFAGALGLSRGGWCAVLPVFLCIGCFGWWVSSAENPWLVGVLWVYCGDVSRGQSEGPTVAEAAEGASVR